MDDVFEAYERTRALRIIASENWAKGYTKSPTTHAKLIKTEARLQRKILSYFKEMADNVDKLVNWHDYRNQLNAAAIDVIINNDGLSEFDNLFISIAFEDIALATALGAQSGEDIYKIPLGIQSTDAVIQDIARNRVAMLVGKRITPDGKVVDNPKADYVITSRTRNDIRESIRTSLSLGEDIPDATTRLQSVIKNPSRAQTIAQTETVNSYGAGLREFGKQSGAVGKEWDDNGSVDICATNADAGPIGFDDTYPSGDLHPTAHVNCRCSERLIYQNELDKNPDLLN